MPAIHVRKCIQSETLHLPELKPLIGKTVDIIIRENVPTEPSPGENLDFFLALCPEPRTSNLEDQEALAAAARQNPALAAALEVARQGRLDEEAIARLRAATWQ